MLVRDRYYRGICGNCGYTNSSEAWSCSEIADTGDYQCNCPICYSDELEEFDERYNYDIQASIMYFLYRVWTTITLPYRKYKQKREEERFIRFLEEELKKR